MDLGGILRLKNGARPAQFDISKTAFRRFKQYLHMDSFFLQYVWHFVIFSVGGLKPVSFKVQLKWLIRRHSKFEFKILEKSRHSKFQSATKIPVRLTCW